jgi:hypothetical protein
VDAQSARPSESRFLVMATGCDMGVSFNRCRIDSQESAAAGTRVSVSRHGQLSESTQTVGY